MSLVNRIYKVIEEHKAPMTMKEIYEALPEGKKHSIRARIYCNQVEGTKVSEKGKGLFIKTAKGTYTVEEVRNVIS